ncbi:3-phosphoshikimate 1-carboxyvinyltransferase [Stanieria cyanosphaera PCC 7437]|uniref:3-phosphoshikimate 1-carboxyvinyltransferase n=1 Tax=Stanieria cyanosphaera (strain ATCC 29371 / PCC 7437) TaxID=111780 RepID=K9XTD8_STAC7|nr:3-phosphoshikimate 1-carboxyvinyltransferase [Stanieria cyanosphaera]AFZ35329.1 3-phosphoshikimate 1-carboxyvinyltransferase [Stanieria cyanosphaera PCC 7437]
MLNLISNPINFYNQYDLTIQSPASGISLKGSLAIPGDKSVSHRALMFGALAQGETRIQGLLLGEDVISTANCLRSLGIQISDLTAETVLVQGEGLEQLQEPLDVLDAGNSGTTMRLILGILSAQSNRFFTITGDRSLRSRPMSRVIKPLTEMGAEIWGRNNNNLAPLAIKGQKLKPIHYFSPVASAQVKSCLLLTGLMTAGKTTVTEPALSRDHSERMLKAFGADITTDSETNSVTITGGNTLQGQSVIVPGDISSAAFWLVAASIIPDSELILTNVGINPTRIGILDVLGKMGANITIENQKIVAGEPIADLRVRYSPLQGCEIAGELTVRSIDEIPIIVVAAALAQGTTIIKDAAELRVKECDRLSVMATQLSRMGAKIIEHPDGLEIQGGHPLSGTEVSSYDDHRIAMSLTIAALQASATTLIKDATAANISYPNFFDSLQQVCHL